MYEDGRLPFYHFDVYRIGDIEEMEEIGYEDCFYGEGVCLIEWADLIQEILPPDVIAIEIREKSGKRICYRKITISDPGGKESTALGGKHESFGNRQLRAGGIGCCCRR